MNELKKAINALKKEKQWPTALAKTYGDVAAICFACGMDIFSTEISDCIEDMKDNGYDLASEEFLSIADMLPPIFSGRYDLEFMEQLKEHMDKLASKAYSGEDVVVHSVMDELCLYMASETASDMIHDGVLSWTDDVLEDDDADMVDEWFGEVCGDEDIKMLWDKKLYKYVSRSENPYCFDNWNDDVFNMSKAS